MFLVLGAMTEESHGLAPGQMLQETQGEFLAVILDLLVAAINRPVFAQFPAISDAELGPGWGQVILPARNSFLSCSLGPRFAIQTS